MQLRQRDLHVCEKCGEQSYCADWRHICAKQDIYHQVQTAKESSSIKIAKILYVAQLPDAESTQMFKIGSSTNYSSFYRRHKGLQTYSASNVMYHRVYELLIEKSQNKTITARKLDFAWRKSVESRQISGIVQNKQITEQGGREIYAVTDKAVQIDVKFEEWLSQKQVRFARRSINPQHYKNGHYAFADQSTQELEKKWLFPTTSSTIPPQMPNMEMEFTETIKTTKKTKIIKTASSTVEITETTQIMIKEQKFTAKSHSQKAYIEHRYANLLSKSSKLSYRETQAVCRETGLIAVGTKKVFEIRLALMKWTKKQLQEECTRMEIGFGKKTVKRELVNLLTKY